MIIAMNCFCIGLGPSIVFTQGTHRLWGGRLSDSESLTDLLLHAAIVNLEIFNATTSWHGGFVNVSQWDAGAYEHG